MRIDLLKTPANGKRNVIGMNPIFIDRPKLKKITVGGDVAGLVVAKFIADGNAYAAVAAKISLDTASKSDRGVRKSEAARRESKQSAYHHVRLAPE